LPVRRFLAIVLLALLPLQFSWAAVATYCGHETQAAAGHLGHHDHQHHADASSHADAVADRVANSESAADVQGDKAPGAMDLDCGHCHGYCGVMVTLPAAIPGAPGTARPSATLDETVGAHAPTRPERPQWLPVA
jgi:hypothetical protein